ncbi:hypothetical protein HG530_006513 [Fusarium avenaceum]|nr:hypothetical protein HG530_006513 [Fusarium avenaceum]
MDDTASPDIDCSAIILLVRIYFRGNIRPRTTQPGHHMDVVLPSHTKAVAVAEITDLESTVPTKQQVFWLEIAVHYTHLVQILDSAHQLLKEAVRLLHFQLPRLLHEREEVAAFKVLHHLAVVPLRINQ